MDLNKIINRLNPRAPRGIVCDTSAWIRDRIERQKHSAGTTALASEKTVCPAESRLIDFNEMKPVTEEDYLLEIDIAKNLHVESQPKKLFAIPGGRVLGPEGYIISPDNRLFTELSYTNRKSEPFPVFRRRRFPKLKALNGTYASLVYPDSGNYYHWLLESLPNLRAIERFLPSLDGIFVPKLKRFHIDSLAGFGIDPERLIELTSQSYFACECLLAPTFSSSWELYSWIPGWLKQSLATSADISPKQLYLARRDAGWRKVSNEQEVIALLESAGYQVVDLSEMSCREQANLLSSARSVISVHGAGLANLAFCRPGTKVLEIFPPKWTSLCYLKLSAVVGCDYHYMIAAPLGQDKESLLADSKHVPTGFEQQGADLEIPLDKLEKFVRGQI